MMTKETKDIIKSVFDIDFESFMSKNGDGQLTLSLCKNSEDLPYPLHYISACWDILFSYLEEWKEKYKPVLKKRKDENDKFLRFFIELGLDVSKVPFSDYCDVFYCDEPDATIEDCLGMTEDELRKLGFRDIDIELACCVEKFQFDRAEQLLEQGADPLKNRTNDEDDYEDCVSRIYQEVEFFYSEFQDKVLGKKKLGNIDSDLSYLFGLAAHEKMDHLLDKYYDDKEE